MAFPWEIISVRMADNGNANNAQMKERRQRESCIIRTVVSFMSINKRNAEAFVCRFV